MNSELYILHHLKIRIFYYLFLIFFSAIIIFSGCIANSKNINDIDRGDFYLFDSQSTEDEVLDWQKKEHSLWGMESNLKFAKKRKYKNTVVMQRSGSKRLYDHNIFLGSMFDSMIWHNKDGNLGDKFKNAVFIDIGSGILCEKGAPTVRDIFEDDRVWTNLSFIVATDINAPKYRYVDTYKIMKGNLPFPVKQINMKMIWKKHFKNLTNVLLKDDRALIFRSANSGPDLYYPSEVIRDHFRAMLNVYYDRYVLYFFSKFILYKGKNEMYFQKIGEIDSRIGLNHRSNSWEKINWAQRKLEDVFIPNMKYITLKLKEDNGDGR